MEDEILDEEIIIEEDEEPIEEPVEDEEPIQELAIEERYQNVKSRISELEEMKHDMDEYYQEKLIELEYFEEHARQIRNVLNQNIFANTQEFKELEELKTVERVLET